MKVKEMIQRVNEYHQKWIDEEEAIWMYEYIGVRFENKEREIGGICESSKDNPDRVDERDFPEYGTPEYDEMPERDGTCAWDLRDEFKVNKFWLDTDVEIAYPEQNHCYIVVGNKVQNAWNKLLDEDEIIIIDAEVVAKIY